MNSRFLFFSRIEKCILHLSIVVFLFSFMSFPKANSTDYNISKGEKVIPIAMATDKGEKVIPIAMATDNRYVLPTLVSMTSICESKNKDTVIKFNIMLSGEVNAENKKKMKKLEVLYKNVSVELIDMKNQFNKAFVSSYITSATYYRCNIPSLLKQYDKVLYIDVDTATTEDLWNLHNTDIDGYDIGAVKDLGICKDDASGQKPLPCFEGYEKKLGIKDTSQYVNAGVLLMNTKKMRMPDEDVEKKFYDYIPTLTKRGLWLHDQDTINAVCYKKIKFLDPKYNLMIMHNWAIQKDCVPPIFRSFYNKKNWSIMIKKPAIVHYAGENKPWKTSSVTLHHIWDKYHKIVKEKILNDGHPVSYGVYTIVSALDENYVLDVNDFRSDDETNIQLWKKNGTIAQKFKLINIKGDEFEIRPICSGKSLDIYNNGQSAGTNVQQYSYHGANNQRFYIKKSGDWWNIQCKCNGLYLDVSNGEVRNGANIWCWPANGTNAQKFKFLVA